jgi:hypothetical protein
MTHYLLTNEHTQARRRGSSSWRTSTKSVTRRSKARTTTPHQARRTWRSVTQQEEQT